MNFINDFLGGAVEVVTGFGSVLAEAVKAVGSVFYTPGVGEATGELTIVGSAMALALGVGAIYLLFRMIRGLIKQNNRG